MAFLEIRAPTLISVIIIIFGLLLAGFFLLFGVANLINPDVPDSYLARNTQTCLVLCGIGLVSLLVAIAALRGVLLRKKSSRE